ADRYRPGLPAGDGAVGWVLEPVALPQAVDDAPVEIGDVTGYAFHFRVLDGFDHYVVASPVNADLANLLGRGGGTAEEECRSYNPAEFMHSCLLSNVMSASIGSEAHLLQAAATPAPCMPLRRTNEWIRSPP